MPPNLLPRNPYVAGKALGDERGFFGREDIFRLVETALSSPDQNALVLFGQRRIGKTLILLQLRRHLLSPPFHPVYFDLMDQARKPLSTVLYELAATVAAEFNLPPPPEADFGKGDYFGLLRTFSDSGDLKQNYHEQVAGGKLENPCESMDKRTIFSLSAGPSPGLHQK